MIFHRQGPEEVAQDANLFSNFDDNPFNFNLSFLAQETMELSTRASQHPMIIEQKEAVTLPQEGPGLIYRVERSGGTFCLRALACENVLAVWPQVQEDWEHFPRLKITTSEQLAELRYYGLDRLEYGEVIVDLLANRRFPFIEDMLCNLSDPGPSWYLSKSTEYLQIYFKSPSLSQGKDLINIGPIGDKKIAQIRWKRDVDLWHQLINLQEYRIDEKGIYLRPIDATSNSYQHLRTLFLEGDMPGPLDSLLGARKKSLQLYCQELAYGRKFWRALESEIRGPVTNRSSIFI